MANKPVFTEYNTSDLGLSSLSHGGTHTVNHWLASIRRQVYEFENKEFTPLNFFREFSSEVKDLFSNLIYFDAEEKKREVAPIFYANQERAIAKISEEKNFKLPILSFSIQEIDDDEERRKPDFNLVIETKQDFESRRYIRIVSMAPKAVKLRYTLYIWAKYVENMNQIVEQIETKFNPYLQMKTPFGDSFHAHLVDVADMSTVAAPDLQDRVLRKSITFDIDAYIPTRKYQITNTGDIHNVYYDIQTASG